MEIGHSEAIEYKDDEIIEASLILGALIGMVFGLAVAAVTEGEN